MPLSPDSVSRAQLRQVVADVLMYAGTDAGADVYVARDWPTAPNLLPAILVQAAQEEKTSLGRTTPQFNTVITVSILARVEGPTPAYVEAMLDRLSEQIETAVICSPDILHLIQQFTSISTEITVTSQGKTHAGEALLSVSMEVYQLYAPAPGIRLTDIQAALTSQQTGETLANVDVKSSQT